MPGRTVARASRRWPAVLSLLLAAHVASSQVTITRGTNLSVDAAKDGRLAIDLLGDIWIVPGGGGEARQITQDLKSAQRPRWSPDATQLVYQAINGNQQAIWVHDLETSSSRNISTGRSFDRQPAWHPSGDRILYSSKSDGRGFDLWEVDVATGVRWRLSNRPGNEEDAAWSADGRHLVYVHQIDNQWSLILRRHGEAEEILLRSGTRIAGPSWRPDGSLITFIRDHVNDGEDARSLDMIILSRPRLIRHYASDDKFVARPVSWLDRQRMVYSADGQIRQRIFDSWRSRPVQFRATIQPPPAPKVVRERPVLAWHDEPATDLVIHAARLFDGVRPGYQYNKDIVIDGGRIIAVEEHRDRSGATVIDMGNLTVIPGLIDADARLPGRLTPGHGPDLLASGITTIVATHPDADQLNRLWSGKEIPGPRLLTAAQWSIGPTARPELDPTAAVVTSQATGLPTGAALSMQFRTMEIAGLNAEQTLRGMGVNAAAAMLADPYLGRVSTGASADLVFVDGDPLVDVRDVLNVVAVARNGRFYSVSGLFDRAKWAESVEILNEK